MPTRETILREYESGEYLRAGTVNALIAASRREFTAKDGYADPYGSGTVSKNAVNRWPIPMRNDSSQILPAHGVARWKNFMNVSKRPGVVVDEPNDELDQLYYVNGAVPVAANGGYGWGCLLRDAELVAIDPVDGAPAVRQIWGVAPDQFTLKINRYGFFPVGEMIDNYPLSGKRVMLAVQHPVESFLCKCSVATSGSPWAVDTQKDVEVWTKNYGMATGTKVKQAWNYTTAISAAADKLTGTFFAGGQDGAIVAKLKC